jgi:hypothetical protein
VASGRQVRLFACGGASQGVSAHNSTRAACLLQLTQLEEHCVEQGRERLHRRALGRLLRPAAQHETVEKLTASVRAGQQLPIGNQHHHSRLIQLAVRALPVGRQLPQQHPKGPHVDPKPTRKKQKSKQNQNKTKQKAKKRERERRKGKKKCKEKERGRDEFTLPSVFSLFFSSFFSSSFSFPSFSFPSFFFSLV